MISEKDKNDIWSKVRSDDLIRIFISLKTENDVRAFLRDIATEGEIMNLDMRLEVAKKLSAGVSYSRIANELGQSPVTIARINRWLSGGCGGYDRALDALRNKLDDAISGQN